MIFKGRTVVLALVAISVSSAVASASAFAALPEFKPTPAKKKFTGTGGAVRWTMGTTSFTCTKSTSGGEITSTSMLGKVIMTFSGCTEKTSKGECSVHSVGAGAEEIVTQSLKGALGTVKTSEAASGVGLLLEPEATHKWATVAASTCMSESTLSGSLAAEVASIGKKAATNKLVFGVTSGEQSIKQITLDSGKQEKPELECWGTGLAVEGSDELAFEEAVEVT